MVTRIAVIDDDRTLLELAREAFAERAWETMTLSSADGCITRLAGEPPDLVILDLSLAGPDTGWTVLRELRQEPATRTVPIIIWSGAADRLATHADWLAAHGIEVVAKPFELDSLFDLVEATLAEGSDSPALS